MSDTLARPCLAQASLFDSQVLLAAHARSSYVVVFVGGHRGKAMELVSSMRREEGEMQRIAQVPVPVTSTLVC